MKNEDLKTINKSELNKFGEISFGDRYQNLQLIGDGAIGKCYLVTDNKYGLKRVIKVVTDLNLWFILRGNAQKLLEIDHENIVKILGIEVINNKRCVIQEYIPGSSLDKFFVGHDVTFNICIQILEDVLSALDYMYDKRLAHKDIKPSNIIYDPILKKATLVDMDYVAIDGEVYKKFLGTIKYSAPEQAIYNETSSVADCYSLGLVLCHLIIGELPFSVNLKERNQFVKKQLKNTIKNNVNLSPFLQQQLYKLIESLLAYEPQERISIADAMNLLKRIKNEYLDDTKDIILRKAKDVTPVDNWGSLAPISLIDKTFVGVTSPTIRFNSSKIIDSTLALFNDKSLEQDNQINEHESTYRNQLMAEYNNILSQAKITFKLWMISVIVCFILVLIAVYLIIKGQYIEGVITTLLDGFVVAIQKLFSIREDHYRVMVEQKMKHLETGDYLEYAFEKAQNFDNPKDRNREAMELLKKIKECTKEN